MRILELMRCMAMRRHDWQPSRKRPGYETCIRCRVRRKMKEGAPMRGQ